MGPPPTADAASCVESFARSERQYEASSDLDNGVEKECTDGKAHDEQASESVQQVLVFAQVAISDDQADPNEGQETVEGVGSGRLRRRRIRR